MNILDFPESWLKNLQDLHRHRLLNERYQSERKIVQSALDDLNEYLVTLEGLIKSAEQKEVKEWEQRHLPDDDEECWAYLATAHWQKTHLWHFRSSFVISAMSLAEYYMKQICQDVKFLSKEDKGFESSGGKSTIRKFQQYLSNRHGFQKYTSDMWDGLNNLYQVRNTITHALYDVDNDDNFNRREILQKLVPILPGIDFENRYLDMNMLFEGLSQNVIVIEHEFCQYVIEQITVCLNTLCDEVAELCANLAAKE